MTALSYKEYRLQKGSSRSGNFGHAGRPGLVGGSAPIGYQPTTLRLQKEIASQTKKMKPLTKEKAVILDSTGKIIKEFEGDEDTVEFDEEEDWPLMKDQIVIHNHPDGEPLSSDDFMLFINTDMREFQAIGPEGAYKIAKLSKTDWTQEQVTEMREIYSTTYNKFLKEATDKGLSEHDAMHQAVTQTMSVITDKYPIAYWYDPNL